MITWLGNKFLDCKKSYRMNQLDRITSVRVFKWGEECERHSNRTFMWDMEKLNQSSTWSWSSFNNLIRLHWGMGWAWREGRSPKAWGQWSEMLTWQKIILVYLNFMIVAINDETTLNKMIDNTLMWEIVQCSPVFWTDNFGKGTHCSGHKGIQLQAREMPDLWGKPTNCNLPDD